MLPKVLAGGDRECSTNDFSIASLLSSPKPAIRLDCDESGVLALWDHPTREDTGLSFSFEYLGL